MKPFKCGQCGYVALEISDLHHHLLDHSDNVGYFFDINYRTAYPRHQYSDSQTQTDDEVIKDTVLDDDLSGIKSENSTNENTEFQASCTNIDYLMESEMPPKQELADAGLGFYEYTFEGTDSSVPSGGSQLSIQNNYLVPIDKSDQYNVLTANTNHSSLNEYDMLRNNSHHIVENDSSSQNSQFKQVSNAETKCLRKRKKRKQTEETSSSDSNEDSDVESDVTVDCTDTKAVYDNLTGSEPSIQSDYLVPTDKSDQYTGLTANMNHTPVNKFYTLRSNSDLMVENEHSSRNDFYDSQFKQVSNAEAKCIRKQKKRKQTEETSSSDSNEDSDVEAPFDVTVDCTDTNAVNDNLTGIPETGNDDIPQIIQTKKQGHVLKRYRQYMYFYNTCVGRNNRSVLKCTICSFSCKKVNQMRLHISTHNCEFVICEFCGKSLPNEEALSWHRPGCIRKYKCRICGAKFAQSSERTEHERSHNGGLPYVCDQCGKAFKAPDYLTTHLLRVHSDVRNYKCSKCEKSFKLSSCLTRHKKIHNIEELGYSCQFCEKKYSSRSNLKTHMRTHTGDKPYSCVKCGESFSHNVVRKTHQAKCQAVPGEKI